MVDLAHITDKMHKVVEFARADIATIRTGRATSALVENIIIAAYGGASKMRVIELAGITTPDAQSIVISPYDTSIIGDIRRDIEAANVGLTPVIDNHVIRITVPPLTAERRQEYVKMLHVKLEDGRVKLRQIRHDKMTELKKMFEAREITEDDRKWTEDELQKIMDEMMQELEKIGQLKQQELMVL